MGRGVGSVNAFWLKPALLGVQQPLTATGLDGRLGDFFLRATRHDDPALGFSRGVGVLAACSLAALSFGKTNARQPAPAPSDARMLQPGHAWIAALEDAFDRAAIAQPFETRLQYEACARLALAKACLPARLLPVALEAGRRSIPLRSALLPVLGARGRWLAEFNTEWKYAAGLDGGGRADVDDASAVWQNGSHIDRLALFRTQRARDPASATALLRAGLGEIAAKERVEFVTLLEADLSAADQSLLELLLKDRSREVRALAARLLATLPESAHAQQLIAWLAPLVTSVRKLLITRWQCEAPAEADPEWAAAAVDSKRPATESLGERAWWLYQLARQVPLSWWRQHTGMSAADLIAWAAKTDWKTALLRAWSERAGSADVDWIESLLACKSRELQGRTADLLALLPLPLRERHWPGTLAELIAGDRVADVIGSCGLGETLSADYSRPLFASLVEAFSKDQLRHDYTQRAVVLQLATLLHPACLRDAAPVVRALDETPAMAECALAFERIIRVRWALHTFT